MQYANSPTLYDLKNDIYYLAKCNSTSIDDNDMNRIINKYYLQLQDVVRSVNENFYEQVAVTDLVMGDGSYTFPDGILGTAPAYEKIKSIWVAYNPEDVTTPKTTEYYRVDIIDPDAVSDTGYTFSWESPKAKMFGNYFVLLPLPIQGTNNHNQPMYPVTNGVKMYYIAENPLLVNDTDVPNIFPSFHDAITQGALIDVAERLGNAKLKADSEVNFQKRLAEMKSYASARLPAEQGIVEGQDSAGGWSYPFGFNSMS